MSVKITNAGKEHLGTKLANLNADLKNIREEKAVAYNLSGDAWHDNPGFKKLEQDEQDKMREIKRIEDIIVHAEMIEVNRRDTTSMQMGSIGKFDCIYVDFEETIIYEIVGYGESNLEEGRLQYDTPVALNITGLRAGEQKKFETPGGVVTYKLVALYHSWEEAEADG